MDPDQRRRIEQALDKIEDRLRDAEPGWHRAGSPAPPDVLSAAGLPAGAALLWARWDGLELAQDEARILPLAEIEPATRDRQGEGLLRPGDRVVGEQGRDVFVLPPDPWEEGADVVRVDEEGERSPEASSVAHLVLGLLGELSVLYDEHGEFKDDVVAEDGTLEPAAERRLLRRRLDLDPDAPRPRLRLTQILRDNGELRAARSEVQKVLRRAPQWWAALHERGRILEAMGDRATALASFDEAAEQATDPEQIAHALAWAARCSEGEEGERRARRVLELRPEFANHQLLGAQAYAERGDPDLAMELAALGLAVAPRHLGLLELKKRLEAELGGRPSRDPTGGPAPKSA